MEDKIKFERVVGERGKYSLGISLPTEICDFLDIKEGDKIFLTAESGKKGKFFAGFKE